jgi:hypothetical protein
MKLVSRLLVGSALMGASMFTMGASFDGSVPLLCAVTGTISCDARSDCIEGPAEAVNLPVFLKIDVQNKVAQSVRFGGEQRTSEILSMHKEDGSLVLLGVDQGAGWSTSIGTSDGKLTLSVSGAGIGYIAFGACIPQ